MWTVRDADPDNDWWNVAALHCDAFYPRASLATPLLRLDRVLGLAQGVTNEIRLARGPFACMVAVSADSGRVGDSDDASNVPFLLRWLPPSLAVGFAADPAAAGVLGCVVVDAQGGRLPPRTLRRNGTTRRVERPGLGYISNLAVAAPARGRGVATSLLHAALDRLWEWDCRFAALHVGAANAGAARLYTRAGFRRVDVGARLDWGVEGELQLMMKARPGERRRESGVE